MKFTEFLNQAAQHAAACIENTVESGQKMGRQTRDFEFEHGDWFARITADITIYDNATGYYLADFDGATTEVYFEGAEVAVAQPLLDFVVKVIDAELASAEQEIRSL